MSLDLINCVVELLLSLQFVAVSGRMRRHQQLAAGQWLSTLGVLAAGIWNVAYYRSLGQNASALGALVFSLSALLFCLDLVRCAGRGQRASIRRTRELLINDEFVSCGRCEACAISQELSVPAGMICQKPIQLWSVADWIAAYRQPGGPPT